MRTEGRRQTQSLRRREVAAGTGALLPGLSWRRGTEGQLGSTDPVSGWMGASQSGETGRGRG